MWPTDVKMLDTPEFIVEFLGVLEEGKLGLVNS